MNREAPPRSINHPRDAETAHIADSQLRPALRAALDEGRISVDLQPIVDAHGGTMSFEALARWRHCDWGAIDPERFIHIAEACGWIAEIDERVLMQVCKMLATRRARGLPIHPVAVNVSAASFCMDRFAERTRDVLDRYRIGRHEVEIEVTETFELVRNDTLIATMNALRSRGIKLMLDDFGAGYASLNCLVSLPFSGLKIDQFLVRGLERHDGKRSIVRAILEMAASLQLAVVAEGVQTLEEWGALRGLGCLRYQGFLFGMPRPASTWQERLVGVSRDGRDIAHVAP